MTLMAMLWVYCTLLRPLPVSLLPGHHDMNASALPHAPYHNTLPCQGPETTEPSDYGLEPLKL
jgi:hypothetical protein